MSDTKFESLEDFYPHYLREHSKPLTRTFHFIGTALVILMAISALIYQNWWFLALMPIAGYSFAWMSHLFIEKNKPATFKHPLYSLASDFIMFWHMITNQIDEKMADALKDK